MQLAVYPKGNAADKNGKKGDGFLSVYLEVPAEDAASQPSGWSQHMDYSHTVISQTNEKFNVKRGPTSPRNFRAGHPSWGYIQFLKLTALNDTSNGYIVNDTLIIKCDMTNISSDTLTTAAALTTQLRETHIVDADTAAAAATIAAFPGALPAAAAAIAAVDPSAVPAAVAAAIAAAIAAVNPAEVPGAAPRVAIPTGLYLGGPGGLVYLHPGAQVNY